MLFLDTIQIIDQHPYIFSVINVHKFIEFPLELITIFPSQFVEYVSLVLLPEQVGHLVSFVPHRILVQFDLHDGFLAAPQLEIFLKQRRLGRYWLFQIAINEFLHTLFLDFELVYLVAELDSVDVVLEWLDVSDDFGGRFTHLQLLVLSLAF